MKTYYAINLNQKWQGLSRWALYEMINGELQVIWPAGLTAPAGERPLLPCQHYNTLKQYPAYHFQVKGWGLGHLDKIACNLAEYFEQDVIIYELHGHSPSCHSFRFSKPVNA